jgi:hypothetical protein
MSTKETYGCRRDPRIQCKIWKIGDKGLRGRRTSHQLRRAKRNIVPPANQIGSEDSVSRCWITPPYCISPWRWDLIDETLSPREAFRRAAAKAVAVTDRNSHYSDQSLRHQSRNSFYSDVVDETIPTDNGFHFKESATTRSSEADGRRDSKPRLEQEILERSEHTEVQLPYKPQHQVIKNGRSSIRDVLGKRLTANDLLERRLTGSELTGPRLR